MTFASDSISINDLKARRSVESAIHLELIFNKVLSIINQYNPEDEIYEFNNTKTTNVFYQIEKNGIKVDKNCFVDYYNNKLIQKFNVMKGEILLGNDSLELLEEFKELLEELKNRNLIEESEFETLFSFLN